MTEVVVWPPHTPIVMAGLDPATHPARVCATRWLFCARRCGRDGWPPQGRPWRWRDDIAGFGFKLPQRAKLW